MAQMTHQFSKYDEEKYGLNGAAILWYLRRKIKDNQFITEYTIHGKVWASLKRSECFDIFFEHGISRNDLLNLIAQSAILAVAFTHEDGTQNFVYTLHDAEPAILVTQA